MLKHFQYLIIITLVGCTCKAYAQPYLFKQDYSGPTEISTGGTHCQTSDGGMILIAMTIDVSSSPVHYTLIVKTSSNGSTQWVRRFVNWYSEISNIVQTADSGYFFLYVAQGDPHSYSIVKLDAAGNTVCTNRITLPGNFTAPVNLCCISKPDGGVYIASHVRDVPVTYALCLTEVSPAGNALWSRCYNDRINSNCKLDRCVNGDILLASSRTDTASGFTNPFITRVDSDGVFLWSRFYSFPSNVLAFQIHEFGNGNINLIAATYNSSTMQNETVYIETDPAGNLMRTKRYGNSLEQVRGITSMVVENTKLVITGNGTSGFIYFKIDESGNVISSSKFPNINTFSLGQIAGPGYSFGGGESSLGHPILFSTDTSGTTCFSIPLVIDTSAISFSVSSLSDTFSLAVTLTTFNLQDTILPLVSNKLCEIMGVPDRTVQYDATTAFPNPSRGCVYIESADVIFSCEIYDEMGRLVSTAYPGTNSLSLDFSGYSKGIYTVRLIHDNHVESQRLIIE